MSPPSQNLSEPIAFVVYTGRQQSSMLASASCPAHRGAKLRSLSPATFTAGRLESYRPASVGWCASRHTCISHRDPTQRGADRRR
jgi:hypothetical protein